MLINCLSVMEKKWLQLSSARPYYNFPETPRPLSPLAHGEHTIRLLAQHSACRVSATRPRFRMKPTISWFC